FVEALPREPKSLFLTGRAPSGAMKSHLGARQERLLSTRELLFEARELLFWGRRGSSLDPGVPFRGRGASLGQKGAVFEAGETLFGPFVSFSPPPRPTCRPGWGGGVQCATYPSDLSSFFMSSVRPWSGRRLSRPL